MTKSLSNLLKRGMTISQTERVIDYNELIKSKLQTMMAAEKQTVSADGFVSGLNAEIVEQLISDDTEAADEIGVTDEQLIADAKMQADDLIKEAQSQADKIHENAINEANQIADNARIKGYEDGIQQSQHEIEEYKEQLRAELEQQKQQLQTEYEEKKARIEPELVETLTEVFRKVTLTVAEDNQDIILHLINGVMKNVDNSREFVIKVSTEDYKFLLNNQGKIYCAMSKEVQIDIVEDGTMKRNECIIETDSGIFNCSLDIELENLIKELKLLCSL